MTDVRRIALALILSIPHVAAVACSDASTRLVEVNQRILSLLPPGAALKRFVLDDSTPRNTRDDCPELVVLVTMTTRRNAEAHALADALRKESQAAAVEITQTRMDPATGVHTELTLKLR